ncbi:DUF4233 domain-containing protein [Nesterenkonia muleiensis]|uniref:DUF4233 domain-containing protein n=1 Tax=Nesterenkonia muleiensis TaxID=2282648 RepID=UPI000E718889|nr:DUF4233 domain-containing protein [Nesterenkonia muleiensis]
MARQTRAQREWESGQTRPPRSVKALFASTVLCLEGALMFFFGLAAWGLNQNEPYAWWLFGAACAIALLCVALCGVLHKRWGYPAGWVMQGAIIFSFAMVALITSQGLVVPLAVLPGIAFAVCWWYAVSKGAQLDEEKMKRYRVEEQLHGERQGAPGPEDANSEENEE